METVTAALMNTHVRDNLLETMPAKVTTAGDVVYGSAANALVRLALGSARAVLRSSTGSTGLQFGPATPLSSQLMGAALANYHVEGGTATVAGIAANDAGTVAITFANAYAATPQVVAIGTNSYLHTSVTAVSTTGATLALREHAGTTFGNVNVHWMAIGSDT